MWTAGTLLAGSFTISLVVLALPAEWADDVVVATVTGLAGFVAILGWVRWQQLERAIFAAFGWPGE